MQVPFQMRAPSKRWMALAGVLVIALVTLAWSFGSRLRTGILGGAPAHAKQKAGVSRQAAGNEFASNSDSASETRLIDSNNDGIPDAIELRTFQDRDNFRSWF